MEEIKTEKQNFNTSHVVVYLMCIICLLLLIANFNTSHVVVYRQEIQRVSVV